MKLIYIIAITCTFSEGGRACKCFGSDECDCPDPEASPAGFSIQEPSAPPPAPSTPQPSMAPTEPLIPMNETSTDNQCSVCLENFTQTRVANRLLKPNGEPACNGLHPICGECVERLRRADDLQCPTCRAQFSQSREYFNIDATFDQFIQAFPKNRYGGYDVTMFADYLKARVFPDSNDAELTVFVYDIADQIKCDRGRAWVTREEIENNWPRLTSRLQELVAELPSPPATQIAPVCSTDYFRDLANHLISVVQRICEPTPPRYTGRL